MCRAPLVWPVSTSLCFNEKKKTKFLLSGGGKHFILLLISLRCKRYEKFPTAVLKTAVPYDYGGIDIIDELPLPSSKKTKEHQEEEEENTSKTQSYVSGPEEPSLRNVVTAAEDFIKVLATVSTSQSSTASSDRGETQGSEKKKKKRKNTGKKKNGKKQKGKGKWRKNKKQKAEPGGKADEGAAASASGSKGEVKGVSTFVGASHRRHPSGKRTVTEHQPVRKEEPLNEVMKDEPAVEKETVSVTPTPATEKKPETTTEILCPTTVSTRRKRTKHLRQREGKKTVPYLKEPPGNGTDISVTTSRASGPQQQSFRSIGRDTENQPGAGTAAPAVGPKVKRTRSEESGDREWRKKRRKDSSASPTEPTPNENKPAEHLKAIPLREAPAVPSDRDEGRAAVPDVPGNTSFSVLKTRKLKEKALRSSRRKAALAAAGGKASQAEENLLSPPPQTSESGHGSPSASSAATEETQARTERLSPPTKAPSVTNRHRQTIRKQRRSRKRIGASAAIDGVSVFNQSEQPAAGLTPTPPDTSTATTATTTATGEADWQQSDKITTSTSASPILTPVQLSVERLRAQFNRKKRRKMAMRRQ